MDCPFSLERIRVRWRLEIVELKNCFCRNEKKNIRRLTFRLWTGVLRRSSFEEFLLLPKRPFRVADRLRRRRKFVRSSVEERKEILLRQFRNHFAVEFAVDVERRR